MPGWATRKRAVRQRIQPCRISKASRKGRPEGVPQGHPTCRARRLLSGQQWSRDRRRGNPADDLAPAEMRGRWTAQACNRSPRKAGGASRRCMQPVPGDGKHWMTLKEGCDGRDFRTFVLPQKRWWGGHLTRSTPESAGGMYRSRDRLTRESPNRRRTLATALMDRFGEGDERVARSVKEIQVKP